VLATGARELFLPFPGWTRPGVVGAGAAQALVKAGASFAGQRVVIAGTGPLLLPVAAALRAAGAVVVGIVEQAPLARLATFGAGLALRPRRLAEALGYGVRLAGVRYLPGSWVKEALGRESVERVIVTDGRRESEWACDLLACGFGLVANLELPRLLGCAVDGGRVVVDEAQQTSRPSVFAAGELSAVGGLGHALATGAIAGLNAAGRAVPERLLRDRAREAAFAERLAQAFAPRAALRALARPDTIVCRCEDVTLAAVDGLPPEATGPRTGPAALDARAAKLHTRAGMGACQGRVCGAALGFLRGATGLTIRPPLVPAPLSVLADGAPGAPVEEELP
jgi:NADPH-dependent 2,4-dienoyl-CoA reductase/sulfur reductase-like enzyme